MDSINLEIFGQLILAVLLGVGIGIERELTHKTAGMRTFALVSLGACLFSIISQGIIGADPARIAAQIVVGIGFLGAGAIIFREQHIQGMTTAAALWAMAAIGMAIGFKLYAVSIFASALVVLVLAIFFQIEKKIVEKNSKQ
jgi:putative Mg2+ transporter-C (MgtC) family protein